MQRFAPVILLLAFFLPACASPRPSTQPAFRPAIEAANQELMARFNRGDKLGVARMYEDSAVMMTSDEQISGRKAIDAYWVPAPSADQPDPAAPAKWTLEIISVEGSEEMPVQRGRSIIESTWKGEPRISDVQFIVVWRKQPDGTYRIAVDAWWTTESK